MAGIPVNNELDVKEAINAISDLQTARRKHCPACVCSHAAELVRAGNPPGRITHIDFDGMFFMGWVCDACLHALNQKGLQSYLKTRVSRQDYPTEMEIDGFLDVLDLQPVCPKCLEVLASEMKIAE